MQTPCAANGKGLGCPRRGKPVQRPRAAKRKRGRPPKNKTARSLSRVNYVEGSSHSSEDDNNELRDARKIKRETLNELDIFEDANADYEADGWQLDDGEGAQETFADRNENLNSVPSGHTVPKKTKMRMLFGRLVPEKKTGLTPSLEVGHFLHDRRFKT